MKLKMNKLLALLSAVCMTAAVFSGCAQKPAASGSSTVEKTDVNVVAIKGPTGVGMVDLMEENDNQTAANKYTFSIVSAPDDAVAKITSGEADIAAVPTNLAAALYKKTEGKVQMLAVNTLGVLYIMENGTSINNVADLKGKTIYTTGQGANPEYILDYILTKNGLDPAKDVNIVFKTENDELSTLLATGEAQVALVPEPIATTVKTKNSSLRVALDMTKEWDSASGGSSKLMMGCVAARKAFVDEHPEAVKAFLTEYKASIEKANGDLDTTAANCEKYQIIPKAALAKAAIPGCSLTYVDGNGMMNQIKGYFEVLYTANPKSVGGALPDDTFYYQAK